MCITVMLSLINAILCSNACEYVAMRSWTGQTEGETCDAGGKSLKYEDPSRFKLMYVTRAKGTETFCNCRITLLKAVQIILTTDSWGLMIFLIASGFFHPPRYP